MNWSMLLLTRLADTLVLSTVLLLLALLLRLACRGPALRMALAWGIFMGLLLLAAAPWLPIGSHVHFSKWFIPLEAQGPASEVTRPAPLPTAVAEPMADHESAITPSPEATSPEPWPEADPFLTDADVAQREQGSSAASASSPGDSSNSEPTTVVSKTIEPDLHEQPRDGRNEPTPLPSNAAPASPPVPISPPVGSRPSPSEATWLNFSTVLSSLWLTGFSLAVGWIVVGGLRAGRLIRHSRPAPEWALAELQQIAAPASPPDLRTTEAVTAAAVLGTITPRILLPTSTAQDEPAQRPLVRAALAHEWAHVRHGDLWLLALERLLLPVYFAQPLFWVLRRLVRSDQELLADAAAAGDAPIEYAAALVEWARTASRPPVPSGLAAMSLWDVRTPFTWRVEMLLNPASRRPLTPRGRVLALLLTAIPVLALSVCTLQSPAAPPETADAAVTTPESVATQNVAQESEEKDAASALPTEPKPALADGDGIKDNVRMATIDDKLLELDVRDAELDYQARIEAEKEAKGPWAQRNAAYNTAKAKVALDRATLKLEAHRLAHPSSASAPQPAPNLPTLKPENSKLESPNAEAAGFPTSKTGRKKKEPGEDLPSNLPHSSSRTEVASFKDRLSQQLVGKSDQPPQNLLLLTPKSQSYEDLALELLASKEHAEHWKATAAQRGPLTTELAGNWVRLSSSGQKVEPLMVWRFEGPILTVASTQGKPPSRFLVSTQETSASGVIDMEHFADPGNFTRGLFKIEKNQLTVCIGRKDAPRPAEFRANDDNTYPLLMVFDRASTTTQEYQGKAQSITAAELVLDSGKNFSLSPETRFVRITPEGEQPLTANDVTDQDVLRIDLPFPYTGPIQRIEVTRPNPPPMKSEGELKLEKALATECTTNYKDNPLERAIGTFAEHFKIRIDIDKPALEKAGIDLQSKVTHQAYHETLHRVLKQILQPVHLTHVLDGDGLRVVLRDPLYAALTKQHAKTEATLKEGLSASVVIVNGGPDPRLNFPGLIIDPRGYVLMHSGLSGRRALTVKVGKDVVAANFIASDQEHSLALLHITPPKGMKAVALAPDDAPMFELLHGFTTDPVTEVVIPFPTRVMDTGQSEYQGSGRYLRDLIDLEHGSGIDKWGSVLLNDKGQLAGWILYRKRAVAASAIRRFLRDAIPTAPSVSANLPAADNSSVVAKDASQP